MAKILKPGDPEFESMRKEFDELKADEDILSVAPSAGQEVPFEIKDFPHFQVHFGIVPMGDLEDQVVFHFKKLSRIMMARLNAYLPTAVFEMFGGVNPAEIIKARESELGEEYLEYRSQYDMVFYRVKRMNSKNVVNAVLKVIEAFPG